LDGAVQMQMGQAMGHDFSGVRVHTSPEANSLNHELGAKAFTTGQDIFFKQGEYNPGSSSGKELLAHELTHVVQQSTGQVPGGNSGMRVTAANDAYEQEADAMARQTISGGTEMQMKRAEAVQRQAMPEEEEPVQAQRAEAVQRQAMPEEEEPVQAQRAEAVQRQAMPEEEEEPVQTQRAEAVQRQEMPEEALG